jgi:hypothetical protein
MGMGVAVWLVDCWPSVIVHSHVCLVTVGNPDLLRLDRRHNQAESYQPVFLVYHKAGAFCDAKSRPANRREHQILPALVRHLVINSLRRH